MVIERSCVCGKVIQVEEHAGASASCPACGAVLPAPALVPALALDAPPASADEDVDEDEDDEEDEDGVPGADGLTSSAQLAVASLLAGPLAGTVLLTRNYWLLGSRSIAAAALAACMLLTAIPVWLAYTQPRQFQGLVACVWVGVAGLGYALQEGALRRNRERGGRPAAVRLVVWISLACALAPVGLIVFAGLPFDSLPDEASVSLSLTGSSPRFQFALKELPDEAAVSFGKGEAVLYRAPVTEDEALALGNHLQAEGIFDDTGPDVVRLRYRRGAYEVSRMFSGDWNDPGRKEGCRRLATRISQEVFDGKPVRFRLCKQNFRLVTTVSSAP